MRIENVVGPVLQCIGLIGLAMSAAAQPVVHPQWQFDHRREVFASETSPVLVRRSWEPLADGGVLMVTDDGARTLVRKLGADGASVFVHVAGDVVKLLYDAIVRAHEGGAVVMLGDSVHCTLRRVDASGTLLWTADAPTPGRCRELHVLADGSIVSLTRYGLARITSEGATIWHVDDGDGGNRFGANDMALDQNGTIWIAARGARTGDDDNDAALLRFGVDGQRRGENFFRCSTCTTNETFGVDVLPDGDVIAVGDGGDYEPGFIARYTADGTRRWLATTAAAAGYDESTHDASGHLYARKRNWLTAGQVHRVDPDDGHVVWSRFGLEMVATSDGVVVGQLVDTGDASRVELRSYDAAGVEGWSYTENLPRWARFGGAATTAAGPAFLVQSYAVSHPCGMAPRVLAFDATGAVTRELRPCFGDEEAFVERLDARPDVGVLAQFSGEIVARAANGTLRWRATPCPWCLSYVDGTLRYASAVLRGDGGAWVLEGEIGREPGGYSVHHVHRLDALGGPVASAPVGGSPTSGQPLLLPSDDDVLVLVPREGAVDWTRVENDGDILARGRIELSWPSRLVWFDGARRLADGRTTLALTRRLYEPGCFPFCPPDEVHIDFIGLAADGSEAWRHTDYDWLSFYGALTAVVDEYGDVYRIFDGGAGPSLQRIGADGGVSVPQVLTGVQLGYWTDFIGPVGGRLVVKTEGELWSFDLDGGHLTRRDDAIPSFGRIKAAGNTRIFLSDRWEPHATTSLLEPLGLETLATFALHESEGRWAMLDDGVVYAGVEAVREGLSTPVVARFVVPGSPADGEFIFADGFE